MGAASTLHDQTAAALQQLCGDVVGFRRTEQIHGIRRVLHRAARPSGILDSTSRMTLSGIPPGTILPPTSMSEVSAVMAWVMRV